VSASTVPVVFLSVSDPVEQGFVASVAKPGGNLTGFTAFEFSIGGKWLDLLKEIAPSLQRGPPPGIQATRKRLMRRP
jgi:putative ABC transport system substrate-binding protein